MGLLMGSSSLWSPSNPASNSPQAWLSFVHSLVVGKVAVFSVVDVKETVLEDVDGKVAVLLVVVVKVARPQGNKSLSEGET